MTDIGEPFIRQVSLSANAFTTIFAPAGEKRKVTLVVAKAASFGQILPTQDLNVSPANGAENGPNKGYNQPSGATDVPVVGGNATPQDSNSYIGLQPIFISDSDGLYLGEDSGTAVDVFVQGVRIA